MAVNEEATRIMAEQEFTRQATRVAQGDQQILSVPEGVTIPTLDGAELNDAIEAVRNALGTRTNTEERTNNAPDIAERRERLLGNNTSDIKAWANDLREKYGIGQQGQSNDITDAELAEGTPIEVIADAANEEKPVDALGDRFIEFIENQIPDNMEIPTAQLPVMLEFQVSQITQQGESLSNLLKEQIANGNFGESIDGEEIITLTNNATNGRGEELLSSPYMQTIVSRLEESSISTDDLLTMIDQAGKQAVSYAESLTLTVEEATERFGNTIDKSEMLDLVREQVNSAIDQLPAQSKAFERYQEIKDYIIGVDGGFLDNALEHNRTASSLAATENNPGMLDAVKEFSKEDIARLSDTELRVLQRLEQTDKLDLSNTALMIDGKSVIDTQLASRAAGESIQQDVAIGSNLTASTLNNPALAAGIQWGDGLQFDNSALEALNADGLQEAVAQAGQNAEQLDQTVLENAAPATTMALNLDRSPGRTIA